MEPRVLPLVGVLGYLDSFWHHCQLPKVSIAREVENCVSRILLRWETPAQRLGEKEPTIFWRQLQADD